jgi:2-polyprenyl-3-methyl-5-hydroxy-6-metoxy-1,4-benzoquinol methylase
MSFIKKISDNSKLGSMAFQFRQKRNILFISYLNKLKRPIKILDVGGTSDFWRLMDFKEENVKITILNLEKEQYNSKNITCIAGDATNLSQFGDEYFDVVFSNSVIEHLFTWGNQILMAREVERVGKNYFVQTPNLYFPLEPHWLFPFFQFLPKKFKIFLTKNFSLGHIGKIRNTKMATKQVEEVKLLSEGDLRTMFPNAHLYKEKFMLFNKSFVAHNFKE